MAVSRGMLLSLMVLLALHPVTHNWSGDPDAWSLVKDHVAAWHPAVGALWILLIATAAAAVVAQAGASRTVTSP